MHVLGETRLEAILAAAGALSADVLVLDSIQTVYTDTLESAPGNVGQVRECSGQLMRFAKESGSAVIVVGHVTKGGGIAGPKTLEHIVDTVLYFEGEVTLDYRLLRDHQEPFWLGRRAWRLLDDGARARSGAESVCCLPRSTSRRHQWERRDGADGGNPSGARRGAGTRGAVRLRHSTARRDRPRSQATRGAPRRTRAPSPARLSPISMSSSRSRRGFGSRNRERISRWQPRWFPACSIDRPRRT